MILRELKCIGGSVVVPDRGSEFGDSLFEALPLLEALVQRLEARLHRVFIRGGTYRRKQHIVHMFVSSSLGRKRLHKLESKYT